MREVNKTVLSANDDITRNGITLDAQQLVSSSFHFIFSDTDAAGTVKLQVSNDLVTNGAISGFEPTNWIDLPNQSASVTAGSQFILSVPQMSYRWIRAVFTKSSAGSGTITCNMFALSI